MKLKIFTGRDVKTAMAKVREDLGDDAVIINVDENAPGGVRISAAFEPPILEEDADNALMPEDSDAALPAIAAPYAQESLISSLRYHNLPSPLVKSLADKAEASGFEDLDEALAAALESLFNFSGIGRTPSKPIILVGPPGAGKTTTAAKIAAHANILGTTVQLYSTDLLRSAGVAQLELLCQKLDLMVTTADSGQELRYLLKQPHAAALQVIDTTGVNAYSLEDAQRIARLAAQSGAEPIFVLPAGVDALEAAEQAHVFSSLGVKRMLVTRLDGARRFAGVITALFKGRMALAGLSASPFLADGLIDPTPLNLSRFLLSKPDPSRIGAAPQKTVEPLVKRKEACQ